MGRLLNIVNQLHRRTGARLHRPDDRREGPLLRGRAALRPRLLGWRPPLWLRRLPIRWPLVGRGADQLVDTYCPPGQRAASSMSVAAAGFSCTSSCGCSPAAPWRASMSPSSGWRPPRKKSGRSCHGTTLASPSRYPDRLVRSRDLHQCPPQSSARRMRARALAEMERVATDQYLVVESFRTPEELFNLQCWALTCEIILPPRDRGPGSSIGPGTPGITSSSISNQPGECRP